LRHNLVKQLRVELFSLIIWSQNKI